MVRRLVAVSVLGLASVVYAQTTATSQPAIAKQLRINLAYQVALEGESFSPGLLDGKFGRRSQMALKEWVAAKLPAGTDWLDKKVFEALKVDVDGAVVVYEVTDDDAAQVGRLPDDWNEKSKLERLPYDSMFDMLAEKFRCSRGLLTTLNPAVNFNTISVGEKIWVPNVRPFPQDNKARVERNSGDIDHVHINLTEKTIRVYDKASKQVALFHCSIARDKAKLPADDTTVKAIAAPNPEYWFDPRMWPEVRNVTSKLRIPPGPRNPVGLAWISLELPGYGMHGTPKPEMIGKTGSHGCFRLTNWDALRLAGFVREGMKVKIMNPEREGATTEP